MGRCGAGVNISLMAGHVLKFDIMVDINVTECHQMRYVGGWVVFLV